MLKKDPVLSGPREIFQIECMDVLAFPVLPSLPTLARLILRNIKFGTVPYARLVLIGANHNPLPIHLLGPGVGMTTTEARHILPILFHRF
jgi:hypothetical protein